MNHFEISTSGNVQRQLLEFEMSLDSQRIGKQIRNTFHIKIRRRGSSSVFPGLKFLDYLCMLFRVPVVESEIELENQ